MTPDELITKKDLEQFKQELFAMLTPLTTGQTLSTQKWLKNEDVKKILNVSSGTIQNLRVNGSLPLTKIGRLYYYKQRDIDLMLSGSGKKSSSKRPPLRKNKPWAYGYKLLLTFPWYRFRSIRQAW